MTIIITKDGKKAKKINESNFVNEDNLQSFIYENPDSVPLYDIDEDIRLLILAREVPTNSGPVDAIGIDETGEIYVIETKLYKNPDKRLVVAQVLDYGASISENTDNGLDFFKAIENKVFSHFEMSIIDKVSDFYGISNEESAEIIESLKENLSNGKLRFVVLMNHIEKRLKDLITFLNRNSRFDIYGVELEFYKYDDFEITIPKLFGSEIKKEVSSKSGISSRKTWDESSFFEELSRNINNQNFKRIKSLYMFFVEQNFKIKWGTGNINGSFNPVLTPFGKRSLLTVFTDGSLQLNYAWFNENDEQLRFKKDYIKLLLQIFELPNDIEQSKYPVFQINDWIDKEKNIKKLIIELLKKVPS